MQSNKKKYETTFIVNASLDDAQIEAAIARVQDVITKNGGTIESVNRWGRKRLAYSINKKTTGFYTNIEFEAPPALVSQLERAYELDEMILRYLTIRLSRNALKAKAQAIKQQAIADASIDTPLETREPLFEDERNEKGETA
jgi:small subunit ribosomal protein S6